MVERVIILGFQELKGYPGTGAGWTSVSIIVIVGKVKKIINLCHIQCRRSAMDSTLSHHL